MLSIRAATTADIPLIRSITMQVWPPTYYPIIGEQQVAYMLDKFYAPGVLAGQMSEQDHHFIIGSYNGQPVAFAAWSPAEPGVYKLHKLYILTTEQGKGTGRGIIDHIVNDTRQKGGGELRLNVNRFNFAAIAFYEKAGFRRLYDEDIDIGEGYFMNDHVLGLTLCE